MCPEYDRTQAALKEAPQCVVYSTQIHEEVKRRRLGFSAAGGDIANRRFFYDDDLTGRDGLFRQVVQVRFDYPELRSGPGAKVPWLKKLRDQGVYLIDLAAVPVNYCSKSERAVALQQNIDATVALATELNPDGVVLVKQNVFDLLNEPLRTAGLRMLHDEFIPFPASGQQKRFRVRFAAAVKPLQT